MSLSHLAQAALGVRGAGCLRSEPDERDRLFGGVAGASPVLPEGFDERHLLPYVPVIWDQTSTNSCVAQAIAQAIATLETAHGMPYDPLSRRWLYLAARRADHIEGDRGSRIRTALRLLRRHGCMPELEHRWSVAALDRMPRADLILAGHSLSGLQYEWIPGEGVQRLELVRQALQQGFPVVHAGPVTREYGRLDATTALQPWNVRSARVTGLHARVLVQARDDGHFVEVNSYGADWGSRGTAVIENSYVAFRSFDLVVIHGWKRLQRHMEAVGAA